MFDAYFNEHFLTCSRFWYGLITFAMAITIHENEQSLVTHIGRSAYITLGLANDFFSWEKEYDDFEKTEASGSIPNAIWILMQEHSVTVAEAKELCKDRIRSSCQDYLRVKHEFESTRQLSVDLRKYLTALELSISANVVWSQYSARYNFCDNSKVHGTLNNVNSDYRRMPKYEEPTIGSAKIMPSHGCKTKSDNSGADIEGDYGIVTSNGVDNDAEINHLNSTDSINEMNGSNRVSSIYGANGFNTDNRLSFDATSDAIAIAEPHDSSRDILLNRNLPSLEDSVC